MTDISKTKDMQHAFDVALVGLRKQGQRSINKQGNCAYRDGKGNKCGIGHIIPDAHYVEGFDSPEYYGCTGIITLLNASDNLMEKALKAGGIKDPRRISPLLSHLQVAHDHCAYFFSERLESNMSNLATDYGLEYTAPA